MQPYTVKPVRNADMHTPYCTDTGLDLSYFFFFGFFFSVSSTDERPGGFTKTEAMENVLPIAFDWLSRH